MSGNESRPTGAPAAAPANFTQTWRYKLGLAIFIGGQGILVIGLLLPMLGAGAAIAGALVLGGELIALTSIAFLGKEGFKAIKSKIFGAVKAAHMGRVSRPRHSIGIALLCSNVLTTYVIAAYAWVAFGRSTAEDPRPIIWGLDFEQQSSLVFWLLLTGEIAFLIAIYVLGGAWWGRFRQIFVWKDPDSEAG